MHAQATAAPATVYPSAVTASPCWGSGEVSLYTDDLENWREGEPVVVAVPVGRRMLVAACMLGSTVGLAELRTLSEEDVRVWAWGELQIRGALDVRTEADSDDFATGYRNRSALSATYFRLIDERVSRAFGFTRPGGLRLVEA